MKQYNPVITPEVVVEMKQLKYEGFQLRAIADKFGVSVSTVSKKTMGVTPKGERRRKEHNKDIGFPMPKVVPLKPKVPLVVGNRYVIDCCKRVLEDIQHGKYLFRSVNGGWLESFTLWQICDCKVEVVG